MKIAQVVSLVESVPPQSKNGLEFIVSWLTEGLVQRGHDVTLFAPGNSKTHAHLKSLLPKGTSINIVPLNEMELDMAGFSFWNVMYAAHFAQDFDIIHCHNDGAAMVPYVKTPIIQTLHHPYKHEFLEPYLKLPEYAKTLDFITDQYSKINYVTISKRQQEHFKQAEPFYFKKYTTIYNGIPLEQFSFNEHPQDYLFFIGYIRKDKGADVAVQVAKALNMKLILAGENKGQEVFFKEHIEPYLNDKITYIGPVDFEQKNELYKNAIATLAPLSWHEPFGLTLVESQACGTPVIAFNKGAAAEIIYHGKTGFVVNTIDEMCEAVKKIGEISRKNCREWVEKNFSIEKMVDEYEKFYTTLLQ
ncbi:MAG: glycosyltransferase family 4 protein [bacterium]|nr:glycosyltransferase family 4 protein [bacterium]